MTTPQGAPAFEAHEIDDILADKIIDHSRQNSAAPAAETKRTHATSRPGAPRAPHRPANRHVKKGKLRLVLLIAAVAAALVLVRCAEGKPRKKKK